MNLDPRWLIVLIASACTNVAPSPAEVLVPACETSGGPVACDQTSLYYGTGDKECGACPSGSPCLAVPATGEPSTGTCGTMAVAKLPAPRVDPVPVVVAHDAGPAPHHDAAPLSYVSPNRLACMTAFGPVACPGVTNDKYLGPDPLYHECGPCPYGAACVGIFAAGPQADQKLPGTCGVLP